MIVEVLPQPLLLTALDPPELPLDPELEPSLAPASPAEAGPLPEPESVEVPELDVEPLLEGPELDPVPPFELPELDALPEEEAAASLSGEPALVELLPHALAIAARHAVSAERRRTRLVTLSETISAYDEGGLWSGSIGGSLQAVAARGEIRLATPRDREAPSRARPEGARGPSQVDVGEDESRRSRHERHPCQHERRRNSHRHKLCINDHDCTFALKESSMAAVGLPRFIVPLNLGDRYVRLGTLRYVQNGRAGDCKYCYDNGGQGNPKSTNPASEDFVRRSRILIV